MISVDQSRCKKEIEELGEIRTKIFRIGNDDFDASTLVLLLGFPNDVALFNRIRNVGTYKRVRLHQQPDLFH
jgi:hypothetical protein